MSEKLMAMSLPTPSVSRIAAAAPALMTAPPEVIGMTEAAALRQMTARAASGENANPSALSSAALPNARATSMRRGTPGDERVPSPAGGRVQSDMLAESVQPPALAQRRHAREQSADTRSLQHATPNATTISSGPRRSELLVAVAEIDSGSIAIASIIPSDTIESAIAPSPTRIPPRRCSMPTLTT